MSIFLTAIMLSGVVSWFASSHPDGLEWTWQKLADKYAVAPAADPVVAQADRLQEGWTPMPDYNLRLGWLSLAGVVGTTATLALLLVGGRLLTRRRTVER
jgi:cobalt/nickel transport system permease protein